MYFDSGIDNYGGWLGVMKEHKLVKSAGAWYTLEYRKKEYKFQSKDFKELMESNDGLRNHLYKQICEKTILEIMIERVKRSKIIDKVIIATSINSDDDATSLYEKIILLGKIKE